LVAAKYSWQFDVDAIRYGDFDVRSKADYSSQLNLSSTRNKKTNNNEKKTRKGIYSEEPSIGVVNLHYRKS